MSAAEAVESSSRAGQDVPRDLDPEPPQRTWVALVSVPVPVVLAHGDERARSPVDHPLQHGRLHVYLDVCDPPHPSYLVLHSLHPRIASIAATPDTQGQLAYIVAAEISGRLLLQVTNAGSNESAPDLFLCNVLDRTAHILQAVPFSQLHVNVQPSRSIGLIADPGQPGHYLVAQIHPRSASSFFPDDMLLSYSTVTQQWTVKALVSLPDRMRNPSAEAMVLTHAGRLWWIGLDNGIFFCDPFSISPTLRFIPLPAGCEMRDEIFHRVFVAQRRCVAPSEGHLRYVEVMGLSYEDGAAAPPPLNPTLCMWTLVDTEAEEPWRVEYEVPFAEVWAHDSYVDAGLTLGKVPHVALVDPNDHGVIYFFVDSMLFGLDVRARRVVSCKPYLIQGTMLQTSRPIVYACELPPPSPRHDSSSSSLSPEG